MSESARVARNLGRALVVTLAVCAIIATGTGAVGAAGDHAAVGLVDATTEEGRELTESDGTPSALNETTDGLDDAIDDNGTTDELNEPAGELEENVEGLNETTAELDGSVDVVTDGGNGTLVGEIDIGLDDSGLDGVRSGARLENGTLAGAIDGTVGVTATDGGTDESEGATEDPSSDEPDGATAAGDGPDRTDAVDAGLVGVIGGLTLLGGGAATGGAGATGAGAGAGAGTSTILRQVGRTFPRAADAVTAVPWEKLPLSLLRYSRYDDSDPLEHETRREIYEAIDAEPGLYLTALQGRTDVSLSTIRHHLSVLEDEDLVEGEKQNGKRRYYPAQTENVKLAAALSDPATARVLDVLAETGDATNGRIAGALDLDPSTVSHHLSRLEDDGLIERRRDGRTIVNSLTPIVESAATPSDAADRPDAGASERVPARSDD